MRDIITSDRLILRPFTMADVPAVCALVGNYEVAKMLSRAPHPYSAADAEVWIAGHAQGRAAGTDFPYAITRAEDGVLIGCIGLHKPTRLQDIAPDAMEIGYWLGMPFWGYGYATEAGGALIGAYDQDLGPAPLVSGHFTENPQSGHVLEKLGFHYAGGQTTIFCVARNQEVPDLSMLRPSPNTPNPERSPKL
jgi:RimJ/RimL family protein N-acetyltransferase